jgi:hypothetical protein
MRRRRLLGIGSAKQIGLSLESPYHMDSVIDTYSAIGAQCNRDSCSRRSRRQSGMQTYRATLDPRRCGGDDEGRTGGACNKSRLDGGGQTSCGGPDASIGQ